MCGFALGEQQDGVGNEKFDDDGSLTVCGAEASGWAGPPPGLTLARCAETQSESWSEPSATASPVFPSRVS